jgi:hypothetical protein
MKGLRRFFRDAAAQWLNLQYWSADVEASWTITVSDDPDTLQVIYKRKGKGEVYDPATEGPKADPDEDYWLYLGAHDAAVIGGILVAWAAAHGERT